MVTDWEQVLDVLGAADEESWNWMIDSRWYRLVDLMNQHGRLHRVQSEVSSRWFEYRRQLAALD
jgi:hypothetical protein